MKRITLMILSIVCLVATGCTDRDDEINTVQIRIKNASDITFDEVQVGDAEELHLDVLPDSYSAYFEYAVAYKYAYIEIHAGEETYVLQPVDFVGQTPLPPGFYTYELSLSPEGEILLEFIID